MAISDFISTSFLFSIAIIVILIGGIFAYVSYRMSEQDHKLSSMLGLVSTMADEIQGLKNTIVVPNNHHQHQHQQYNENYEDDDEEVGLTKHSLGGNPKLIHVSDDEETSSESETDADESESDESESDDLEEDDESVDSEAEDSDADDLENNNDNINLNNDILDNDINILDLEDMANEITEEAEETNTEFIDLVDVNESTDVAINDIKSIHLAEPINMHLDELSAVEINHDLKTISISMTDIGMNINDFGDDSNKHKSLDYKKMSLNKLREVVVEKGIIPDASKLKKNELLKLLGEE